jgi:ketosteroid isomerase-like protein
MTSWEFSILYTDHEHRASMNDEQLILKLFEDGDRALMSANVRELERIYAEDYVQFDESGVSSTRRDLIEKLTSGKVRFLSMTSTGRRIRLLRDDVAIVHGSEEDDVEQEGQRFPAEYIYMDVVMKREGRWQIVASQLARGA